MSEEHDGEPSQEYLERMLGAELSLWESMTDEQALRFKKIAVERGLGINALIAYQIKCFNSEVAYREQEAVPFKNLGGALTASIARALDLLERDFPAVSEDE